MVPAVPQPLHRHWRFGSDGYLYVERRRRGKLQQRRLRPVRRRPTRATRPTRAAIRRAGVGTALVPADGRRRRAAQPGPAPRRRRRRRSTARSSASTRPRARRARQPVRRPARSQQARRIIAYGLRNPFRFTYRPGTNELWIGDVGWGTWEEIDRIADDHDTASTNFGWPCYEGTGPQSGYQAAEPQRSATRLYSTPAPVTAPVLHLQPREPVVSGDGCPTGAARRSRGMAFYARRLATRRPTTERCSSPTTRRNCIWVDAAGRQRPARSASTCRRSSAPRPESRRPRDRPGRRPVLRRPRRRHDPPHPVLAANQPPIGGDHAPARPAAPRR